MERLALFLSHITEEAELAALIKHRLERDFLRAIDVFVSSDSASLTVGRRWLTEISTALERARIMLVLCSPLSVQRPWIQFESGGGWVRNLDVVPICHSGASPGGLPLPLNLLQGIQATDAGGWEKLYSLVAATATLDVPRPDHSHFVAEVSSFESRYQDVVRHHSGKLDRLRYRAAFYLGSLVEPKVRAHPIFESEYAIEKFQANPTEFIVHAVRQCDHTPYSGKVPVEPDWDEGASEKYSTRIAAGLVDDLLLAAARKDAAREPGM